MGNLVVRARGLLVSAAVLVAACGTKPVTTMVVRSDGGGAPPRDGGMMTNTTPPGMMPNEPKPVMCPTTAPAERKVAGDACACDIECATGTCGGKVCCAGGRPARHAARWGPPARTARECNSGFCADGVCCNVACSGACVACNQAEQMGECAPIPAGGEDIHNVCRRDSPETCGQSGYCNGQGGCAKFAAGTICQLASCDGARRSSSPPACATAKGICVLGVAHLLRALHLRGRRLPQ